MLSLFCDVPQDFLSVVLCSGCCPEGFCPCLHTQFCLFAAVFLQPEPRSSCYLQHLHVAVLLRPQPEHWIATSAGTKGARVEPDTSTEAAPWGPATSCIFQHLGVVHPLAPTVSWQSEHKTRENSPANPAPHCALAAPDREHRARSTRVLVSFLCLAAATLGLALPAQGVRAVLTDSRSWCFFQPL